MLRQRRITTSGNQTSKLPLVRPIRLLIWTSPTRRAGRQPPAVSVITHFCQLILRINPVGVVIFYHFEIFENARVVRRADYVFQIERRREATCPCTISNSKQFLLMDDFTIPE